MVATAAAKLAAAAEKAATAAKAAAEEAAAAAKAAAEEIEHGTDGYSSDSEQNLTLTPTLTLTLIPSDTKTSSNPNPNANALTSAAAKLLSPVTLTQLPQLLYPCSHSYCQTRRLLLTLALTPTATLTFI